jgi:hypothetical protein
MIEDFLHLPPVSTKPVANLELRISPRIFEKIRNGPNLYSGAWGKLIHEKTRSRKSRDTVPLTLTLPAGVRPFFNPYAHILIVFSLFWAVSIFNDQTDCCRSHTLQLIKFNILYFIFQNEGG